MVAAMLLMASENKGGIKITSRTYAYARKLHSDVMSIKMVGNGNPMFGHSCTENMTPEQYNSWLVKHQKENHPFYNKKRPEHSARMKGKGNPMFGKSIKDVMLPEDFELWKKHVSERDISGEKNPFFGKHHTPETKKRISDKNKEYVKTHGHGSSFGKKRTPEQRKRNSESHKHPYSHERKIKQNTTIITRLYGNKCDLSQFDFELYITLTPCKKIKYRECYVIDHPKK